MMPYQPPGGMPAPNQRRSAPGYGHKNNRGHKGHGPRGKKHHLNNRSSGAHAPPVQHAQAPACYNCGSQDHLIQNCPDYHHDTQSGSSKHPRPSKRQRTAGAGSQFYGEPQQKQRTRPNRSFNHPPTTHHPDYHQPPISGGYEPPTPISAEHDEYNPWQHGPPPPHYGYRPHGANDNMAPAMRNYDPQFQSPPSSYNTMHKQPGYYHPQHDYRPREGEYRVHPGDHPPPPAWEARRKQSRRSSGRGDNAYPNPHNHEPWMEELESLDLPEGNPAQSSIVWRPPNPVARPLPATFTDRDEICRLPPLTSLPPGMSVSKYFLDKKPEEFQENIRNTEDWPFIMNDPIFLDIPSDGELVPISELIARRNLLFETHRVQIRESPVHTANSYQGTGSDEEDRELDDASFYSSEEDQSYQTPNSPGKLSVASLPASPEVPRGPESPRDNEQGRGEMTHSHFSPTHDHRDAYDNVSPGHKPQPRPANAFPKRKKFKNRNNRDQRQFPESYNRRPHPGKKRQTGAERQQKNGGNFKSQPRRNPKPKQPGSGGSKQKTRKMPTGEGSDEKTHQTNLEKSHDYDKPTAPNTGRVSNRDSRAESNDHQAQGRIDNHDRKPSKHDDPSSVAEHAPEPQRQVDDVTPKLKRRQPQVAEAYSRRW